MATFVSPIDGKTYSTEWTGNKTIQQVLQDVSGTAGGESARYNIPLNSFTGALTNTPGEALTYANPVNAFSPADVGKTIEMADPDYERWMSAYWAYLHPEEYAATQAEQKGGGGLFDMAKGLATSQAALPLWAALGAGLSGLGGTAAGNQFTPYGLELGGEGVGAALGGGESLAGLGAGGNNMGIFDDLLSQFTDVPVEAGNWLDGTSIGDIGNQLSDLVSNGTITQQQAMEAMQAYNNAASGGDWASFLQSGAIGDPSTAANIWQQLQSMGVTPSNATNVIKSLLGSGTGSGGGSLLGAGLGGLAGLLGGSKQAGTIDQTQTPWGPQQAFLLDAWQKAKTASEANNPLRTQAESNFQSVLKGPTVNPMLGLDNPYLTKQIDNANADVTRAMMPAMNQANVASGSFGNSGVADIYSKNMLDAYSRNANDMRYKDYYAQQQLQKDAVGNTLGFTTGTSAFNAAPAQDYAKTVQGNYGGTTSSPYFTNNMSNILGGATLGYNLFGGK